MNELVTEWINKWMVFYTICVQFSSVQSLSRVQLFATPWIAARQASLSITNSRSSLRLTSIESVMPSSHLILCLPFSSCPQSLPASESFPMSQLFPWGGQSTGVSALASFLPKKAQGWSPRRSNQSILKEISPICVRMNINWSPVINEITKKVLLYSMGNYIQCL